MSEANPSEDGYVKAGPVSDTIPDQPFAIVSQKFPTPTLASEARKDVDKTKPDDLARILTCGDFGGVAQHTITIFDEETGDEKDKEIVNDPCDHPSSFGIPGSRYGITPGKCFKHTDEKLADKARRKALFLDYYCANPERGWIAAAKDVGIKSNTVVYWWADHDPEFKKNFEALKVIGDAVITDMVEEKVIQRLLDPKAGADTLRMWWLQNRRGDRWKNPNKVQGGDSYGAGTPGVNISGGNHVWQIGDRKVQF